MEGGHHKWLLKLLGYDFDIQYRPEKENPTVDALSVVMTLASIPILFVLNFSELEEQVVASDTHLANIMNVIATNPVTYPHFSKVKTTLTLQGTRCFTGSFSPHSTAPPRVPL